LGGFDLALRFASEECFRVVCELKWCSRSGLDALDDVVWDVFKLSHAVATLEGVEEGVLIYAAPAPAWNADFRLRELFSETTVASRDLIMANEVVWRYALGTSSQSRPTRIPAAIRTSSVAIIPFTFSGDLWELRMSGVSVPDPDPERWLHLDESGWPSPA
jgi:hypothetical protein